MQDTLTTLEMGTIHCDPAEMHRVELDTERLADLCASIKNLGMFNPIHVRPTPDGFALIAGHRRYVACQKLGHTQIRAMVRECDEAQAWLLKAHENLVRHDLSPYEEALCITDAINHDRWTIDDAARVLRRSVAWVNARLDLLRWPPEVGQAVHRGDLSIAAARPLTKIDHHDDRNFFLQQAIANGATATTTNAWFQSWIAEQRTGEVGPEDHIAPAIVAQTPVLKQACVCCEVEHPIHQITRLPVCQPCADALMKSLQAASAPRQPA